MKIVHKAVLVATVAGASVALGATPALATPPGFSLCQPVPNEAFPAGGPGFNFVQPPPASPTAFDRVCGGF
jgi:hypothetical protein